jgi:putative transposase
MRDGCAELNVELVEFNGEADHVHLLVAYPPTLAISTWCSDSKAAPLTRSGVNTPARASAPACANTSGPRPTSPSPAEAHHYRSSSNTPTDKPAHSQREAPPGDKQDGPTPD